MSQPVASTAPVTVGSLTTAAVKGRPSCMKSVGMQGTADAGDARTGASVVAATAAPTINSFFTRELLTLCAHRNEAGVRTATGRRRVPEVRHWPQRANVSL